MVGVRREFFNNVNSSGFELVLTVVCMVRVRVGFRVRAWIHVRIGQWYAVCRVRVR